jgi:general secretion pathway protein J
MTRPVSAETGMTLIETLIALFVIALMATAGAVMTGQTLRGARVLETRGEASSELAVALNTISADLAAYTGRPSQDAALSEPAAAFAGYAPRADGRLMLFVRNGWSNTAEAARSDLQRVEYRFEGGNLIRRSWLTPDPGPATPIVDEMLLSGIARLDARFGRAEGWRSEWLTGNSKSADVPQKVELSLTFAEGDVLTVRYLVGAGT